MPTAFRCILYIVYCYGNFNEAPSKTNCSAVFLFACPYRSCPNFSLQWNFLTLFSSNSSSRCDSPIVDHTSTDHQLASAQTDGEGTVAAAAASVGNVVRSRDASGAPQFPRAKKVPSHTTPLEKVKSCIELTHRPPGSPVHPRGRPCSAPMSHCPVMFAMGFAWELFDIARKSIWDENVPPSPDSKD